MKKQTLPPQNNYFRYNSCHHSGYAPGAPVQRNETKNTLYGIEIEFASSINKRDAAQLIAGALGEDENTGYSFVVSKDGTIRTCAEYTEQIELALAADTISNLIARLKLILPLFVGKSRGYNRGGIHITAIGGIAKQNRKLLAARINRAVMSATEEELLIISNRKLTDYCAKPTSIRTTCEAYALGFAKETEYSYDYRGSKLACMDKDYGVELRIFNSNLDIKRVTQHLNDAAAIFNAAHKAKSMHDINGLFTNVCKNSNS